MKIGGSSPLIRIGKGGNALRHQTKTRLFKDDYKPEKEIDTRLSIDELKKPLKAKGTLEKVATKLDKLKIKPIAPIAPVMKRKKKPIVLEL